LSAGGAPRRAILHAGRDDAAGDVDEVDDEAELLVLWHTLDDGQRHMLLETARTLADWHDRYGP
jgi:hypothetical protein